MPPGPGRHHEIDDPGLVSPRLGASGKKVIGCAVAGIAAEALKESSGIESDTLMMTLTRLKHGKLTINSHHVLVIDEAGMVPTVHMAELVYHAKKAGAKLVASGDRGQIQAIQAGNPFGSICERNPDYVSTLTEIHRQREPWRREAVKRLSAGEAKEALIAYAAHDQLHITPTREEAISKIVELWKENQGHLREHARDVYCVTALNCEVRAINRLCQEERLRAGQISEESIKLGGEKMHGHDRVVLDEEGPGPEGRERLDRRGRLVFRGESGNRRQAR